jgi:hypothetical protein
MPHYSLRLISYDGRFLLPTVSAIRSVVQLGLKETADLVRSAPVTIMTDLDLDTAQNLQNEIEPVFFPSSIPRRKRRDNKPRTRDPALWRRPAEGEKCCVVEIIQQPD